MSEPKPTDYYQGQSVSDFIVLHAMPWHLANVVKYLTRWWAKDDMTALYKARDYLDTFIKRCETQPATKAFIVAGIKATIEARRAVEVKPVDAAPAEPKSDYGSLREGDFFASPGGRPRQVAKVDDDGVVWSEFLGGRMTIFEPDYIRYGYRKVAKS